MEKRRKADITINLDAKCKRCGKGGATESGVCLPCFTKAIQNGEFDHILKRKRTNRKGTDTL